MAGASGKKLDETYKLAWLRGLKTTYYLRTQSATQRREVDGQVGPAQRGVERRRGTASRRRPSSSAATADARATTASDVKFCAIDNPECEACQ